MDKQRVLILDQERINRKLQRMAYQIWESNSYENAITLVGVEGSGLVVAKCIAAYLTSISTLQVDIVSLKLNKRSPVAEPIMLDHDFTGQAIILIDDVANSGRTLLHALYPFMMFQVKKIMIAVLVDRKHKSFPISPDIVGHSVATTLHEHIEVETDGNNVTAAYLQ